jgi:magnesium and cobalt transporter
MFQYKIKYYLPNHETEDNILLDRTGRWRVKATTEIEDFNAALGTNFSDEDFDTVGGLVIGHFGHVPKRGEQVSFGGLNFQVLRADSRRLLAVLVERDISAESSPAE